MHATATVRHDRLLEAQETLANEKVVQPASQPAFWAWENSFE